MFASDVHDRTVPDDVQARARALGDPTRFRIFRYVFEAGYPVGVAELTSYTALNHNAVRQHLETLVGAGLVLESAEPRSSRGRPRLVYVASPQARDFWGPSPYERLAGMLAAVLRTGQTPDEVGRQAGLARASERRTRRSYSTDVVQAIEDEMAGAGFRPRRLPRSGGAELVLDHCPFASAAVVNAADVCNLHLGLARGLAEGLGAMEVERLVVKNPRRAGCRLLLKDAP